MGRNVAECAARLGTKVLFMSVVGQDASGVALRDSFKELDMVGEACWWWWWRWWWWWCCW